LEDSHQTHHLSQQKDPVVNHHFGWKIGIPSLTLLMTTFHPYKIALNPISKETIGSIYHADGTLSIMAVVSSNDADRHVPINEQMPSL
jgi:hypothetical protein